MAGRAFFFISVFLVLSSAASATKLEFNTIYPECAGEEATMTGFEESVRCSAYFLAPNLHVRAFSNLVFDGFFDALLSGGDYISNQVNSAISDFFGDEGLLKSGDSLKGASGILNLGKIILSPVVILWGIISSVGVYAILIVWEFLKTYLIIGVSWSLWSRVLFGETKWAGWLSTEFGALVIAGVLVVGTLLLLTMDITIWGVL